MAKRRRLSAGSIFMLALTALVVLLCALFLSMIVGDDLYARTGDFIRMLSQEGFFAEQKIEHTPPPMQRAITFIEDTPAPTPQPTHTPAPQPTTITIAAAGTVYAPKAVRESAMSGGAADFGPVFAGLGDVLAEADLAIATLETTTAGQEKGYDNYNTAPQILDALRTSGVDMLSLATERMLDKGYEGLDITRSELTARGLAYAGVRADGASDATMMRIGGVQVAVLAYTYGLSEAGEEKTGGDRRAVAALTNTQQMVADIRQARVDGANVVIVLPHWGTKNITDTPAHVQAAALALAKAGADIILGTHPNVPQGTQRLRVTRADGLEYDAVVCYSLGSLLTDARTAENTASMIAHVPVTYDPVSRRTTIGAMYCTPVYVARVQQDGQTSYRVVDAEDADALGALPESEREAAKAAAQMIQEATKAQEGQG